MLKTGPSQRRLEVPCLWGANVVGIEVMRLPGLRCHFAIRRAPPLPRMRRALLQCALSGRYLPADRSGRRLGMCGLRSRFGRLNLPMDRLNHRR